MAVLFRKPGFLLARIDQIATALYARRQPMTTLAQSELLLLLGQHGAMPQITLARAAGMDKSTVGLVLDNLEARGWIARATCAEDRRRAQVSLTAEGTAALAGMAADFAELQRDLLAPLTAEDRDRLLDILAGLKANPRSPAPPLAQPAGAQDAPSFLFRRALQHLQAAFAALSPDTRASLRQFALLYVLSRRDAITQTGFARLYGLDPSTCAVILRALAKQGWVSAHRSAADGRERLYRLTDAGRDALAEQQVRADRSQRAAFPDLGGGDLRLLIGLLRRIVAAHSHHLRFPGTIPTDLVRRPAR
ncbi:MarR family winged helix-turn-helix transcriptional regulator [Sphingomonas hengshuiensis]|uniref:MarR family winged helix-turn-helix transcriptional regulator n=1 Tax=Sphingomonas hengshuiensis TaxID=1609977 RepID=UPI00138E33BE|nr:MarR family transcriptional regulator [Sphingomonas hengshuiensis]